MKQVYGDWDDPFLDTVDFSKIPHTAWVDLEIFEEISVVFQFFPLSLPLPPSPPPPPSIRWAHCYE